MAYIAPIHKASSVRHAIKCKFIHEDRDSLIIAKSNRIEIYDLVPDGLDEVRHFTVYGRVTALLSIRPQTSLLDHLFVATDRYDYFTVSWDPTTGNIQNERKAHDVTDRFQRAAHSGHLYLADPEGRLLGLYLYEGIFTAIPIIRKRKGRGKQAQIDENEIGNLDEPCPIRLNEMRIITMAFLYGTPFPVVAVLYKDSKNAVHLSTYEINLEKKAVKDPEFKVWNIKASNMDQGSSLLIPVPSPTGGIVVVGEQMITYYHEDRISPLKAPIYDPTIFQTYGMIDQQRYLLSNETGHLWLLLLVIQADKVTGIRLENLGETCQARAIVYLDNGYVFLGSHFGDSQLVKIGSGPQKTELIWSMTNLAPISDFTVLGTEVGGEEIHQYASGQTVILTCSGGFYDGGIRSVRSGVGISENGILEDMAGVRQIWSLKAGPNSSYDNTILLSFVDETRICTFTSEGDVEELETFNHFSLNTPTLATGLVSNDRLVQVTPGKIIIVDKESSTLLSEWTPPAGAKLDIASLHDSKLAVISGGQTCTFFDLSGETIREVASRTFENEISCIHVPSIEATFLVIGFWLTSSVALLKMLDLTTITEHNLHGQEGVVPRSLLVTKILAERPPTLFVGMGDGEVFTFTVTGEQPILSEKKSVSLGTQAVNLQVISYAEEYDTYNIFASGERPTMVYEEEGRIVYSAVTVDQATFVTAFNAEAYPQSVVLATENEVRIAKVDDKRTTHSKMIPLREFARRVVYSKERKVYSVATVKSNIDEVTGMESSTCFIHVIDENFIDNVDTYELQPNELVECLACIPLVNSDGSFSEKFVVGTAIGNEDDESERGRLLILELGTDKVVRLVSHLDLPGACHTIAVVAGNIVAGLNKTIDVYRYSYLNNSVEPSVELIASAKAATIPVVLAVTGNRIFVGDLIKGVMVLEFSNETDGKEGEDAKLTEVCRQYGVSWITALETLDEDTCITADSECNLAVLGRDTNSITEEDKRRMRPLSELRLGEMVNRIKKVNEPVPPNSIVQPKAYMGTVEGALFMLGLIHPDYLDMLMKFQVNMSKVVKGVGDLDFNRYRAFNTKGKQPDEPFRFVDGELVEKYLELDPNVMEMVIKGEKSSDDLGCSVDEMKNVVEALKRLH